MRALARLAFAAVAVLVVLLLVVGSGAARPAGGSPVALVTAEGRNEVVAVALPGGDVLRRLRLHDPETIVAGATGPAVVVSPSGSVTLLEWRSLRPIAVFRGFRSPQVAALTPDGEYAYVTDAGTGELSVIEFVNLRVVARVFVGDGAHHLAISPDQRQAWVALGESATTIVVLDTTRVNRPRVIRRIHPATAVHDLAFAPDGKTVWLTSASASYVSVVETGTGRLLGTVPAGRAPQHIVFIPYGAGRAYITSGYGSQIELVDPSTRTILRRAELPYGSFNLATSGDLIVTSSLLNGEVTEFAGPTLERWLTVKVAAVARDVAISVW